MRVERGPKTTKTLLAAIAVIVVLILVGLGAWYLTYSPITSSSKLESITIGCPGTELFGLIFIAEDQGFFSENGLNVTLVFYGNSQASVADMLNGSVDISCSPEYPLIGSALKKDNFSVIGCIDRNQNAFIVGRKDRGIENISDLKGKKIGVFKNTILEFYIGRFLDLNGISPQDVTKGGLIGVAGDNQSRPSTYLVNGSVDAIIATQSDTDRAKELLGSNCVVWPAQSYQPSYTLIAGRNDWIASHPEQINRLLKSLVQAEQYVIDHPVEAKAIIEKRTNITNTYNAEIWPNNQYYLTLDQSLLIAMNDEGLWMICNNMTNATTLPDFSRYIYTKGMMEVKPEAVNIR